ncbi:MAG: amino acid ABC transporter permease [Lachnospiraceae bacterium]|nr:amino acid ABC transporter permease [Lachnospiraceae bacterium]SDA63845.1 L-cystine transport system permease protein [Lachnospiraceae bacterium G11]
MKLFDVDFFIESFPKILAKLPVTLLISVAAFLFAVIIGFIVALVKIYKVPILQRLADIYISFIRGTPVLVQLYIICYGIPKVIYYEQVNYSRLTAVDVNLIPGVIYVLVAYSVNIGAYQAETIRSAIEAVGRGQMEAATSVGMTRTQTMVHVIIPQAFVIALPNFGNALISAVKDTSLVFVAGVIDILAQAKILGARVFNFLEVYIAAALVYWAICIVIEVLIKKTEEYIRRYERAIV